MGFLDGLEKLINEHGSAVILKERIALANDKYAVLEAENKVLRSENDVLKLNVNELRQVIQRSNDEHEKEKLHNKTLQNYTQESGALFKRLENGEWDYTPYCPSCKTAMVQPKRHELYVCGKKSCGQRASFTHVNDAVSRLPHH